RCLGEVLAGPVIDGHGLTVFLYKGDGSTLLGSQRLSAKGTYLIDIGDYTGVVFGKVLDSNSGADFRDEATGELRDLSANLMAVGLASKGDLLLNFNPLTTIATLKAMELAVANVSGPVITAQVVAKINAVVASALNLISLTDRSIITTINSDGTPNEQYMPGKLGLEVTYGAVLATLSGIDSINGNNMQATIDNLSSQLTLTGNGATWSRTAAIDFINGARIALNKDLFQGSASSLTALISDLTVQNVSTVSINPIATDGVIDVSEKSVILTGTNSIGASVALSFNGNTRQAIVNGTTWSYTLNTADIIVIGEGGKLVDATATLIGGVTATATRSFYVDDISPVVLSIAISGATGIQGGKLNAGDEVKASVLMSETVVVSGKPQLALNVGGVTVQANYLSGSGSSEIVFSYKVLAGEVDIDGIGISANSLSLNDGYIKDSVGNVALLTHSAIVNNSNYIVDTTAPELTLGTIADDMGSVVGNLLNWMRTDDTSLLLSGTTESGSIVKVYNGLVFLGNATVVGTTWTYSATVANGTTYQFNATATDAAGNTSVATSNFTVISDTAAPVVTLGTIADDIGTVMGDLVTGART
ncbi:MAG: hypothetical protein EBQ70_02630, partial [Betaproteobacteria bacterium]|nr:hypothetical protein [Betaproteobacteria bacterium]